MDPESCQYSKEHEWFYLEDDTCVMGITEFAQDELGEVVFVELPEVGTEVEAGNEIGTIESVKAVSEVFTAISGVVVEVNELLKDMPEKINEDPLGEGWLAKIKLSAPSELDQLMDAKQYAEFTAHG